MWSAEVWVRIPWAASLKDRRQVAQSLVGRLGRQANLAVAELSPDEEPRQLVLGVAAVSGSPAHARALVDAAIGAIEREGHDVVVRESGER